MKKFFYLMMAVATLTMVSCGGATTKSNSAETETKACCSETKECAKECAKECEKACEKKCDEAKKECAKACDKACDKVKEECAKACDKAKKECCKK